jgi:hypothetical protein
MIAAVPGWLASCSAGCLFRSPVLEHRHAVAECALLRDSPYRYASIQVHARGGRCLRSSGQATSAADVRYLLLFAGVSIVRSAEPHLRYVEEPLRRRDAAHFTRKLAELLANERAVEASVTR